MLLLAVLLLAAGPAVGTVSFGYAMQGRKPVGGCHRIVGSLDLEIWLQLFAGKLLATVLVLLVALYLRYRR